MLTVRTAPIRHTAFRSVPMRPAPTRALGVDRSFDRAFDQLVGSFLEPRRAAGPVVDASWQGDTYVLTVDLPGVPASAVRVEVAGTTLTLGAQTDELRWERTVRLGERLDPERVEASHVDGRLTVRVGSVQTPAARTVEIATAPLPALATESTPDAETTGEQTAIEAQSHDADS
jgi:HSP20 family protein